MHPHDYENLKTASRPAKRPADRSVRYSYSPVSGRDVSRSDIPPRSALQQRHGPKVGFHNRPTFSVPCSSTQNVSRS